MDVLSCLLSLTRLWAFDDQVTTTWIASESNIVQAAATAEYAATAEFLACGSGSKFTLYLQTGTDQPEGENCATTQLYVNPVPHIAPPSL